VKRGTLPIAAVLIACLALVAALALAQSASAAPAGRHHPVRYRHPAAHVICGHLYHHSILHRAQMVRNDNFARQPECLKVQGAGFRVTRSAADSRTPEVAAFPYVFSGCSWGLCTRHSLFPRRISALGHIRTSVRFDTRARGRWNAAFEWWVDAHRITDGQARKAEVMCWLRTRGIPAPSGSPVVRVGGVRYWLTWWMTRRIVGGQPASWPLVIFRRVHPTTHATVRIGAFMAVVRRLRLHGARLVSERDWLLSDQAGFEIWRRGRGLGVQDMEVGR
jgi:cellulose 1,4-beta-cellobiosidase